MIKKICKLSICTIIICVIVLLYLLSCVLILERKKDLPFRNLMPNDYYTAVNILEADYKPTSALMTNEEYRKFIENDMGLHCYFYLEKDMNRLAGKTYPLIRLIVIDPNAKGYEYCEVFVHEAIHLKQFIGQEDYVSFETFKYLYNNEELKVLVLGMDLLRFMECTVASII